MSLDIYLDDASWGYSQNITHNLGRMAAEAGMYDALWHGDEHGITVAGDLAPILLEGMIAMISHPTHYRSFDAENGWGLYDHFLPWLATLYEKCQEHPAAVLSFSV